MLITCGSKFVVSGICNDYHSSQIIIRNVSIQLFALRKIQGLGFDNPMFHDVQIRFNFKRIGVMFNELQIGKCYKTLTTQSWNNLRSG